MIKKHNNKRDKGEDQLSLEVLSSELLISFSMTESKGPISFQNQGYSMRRRLEPQMIFGYKLFPFFFV